MLRDEPVTMATLPERGREDALLEVEVDMVFRYE